MSFNESVPIPGVLNYFIDKEGLIYNSRGKELEQNKGKDYRGVTLRLNNSSKHFLVKDLVANSFLAKPDLNLDSVIYKTLDYTNNSVDNIEWGFGYSDTKYKKLIGNKYGDLTVKDIVWSSKIKDKTKQSRLLCSCICGNEKTYLKGELEYNNRKNCGGCLDFNPNLIKKSIELKSDLKKESAKYLDDLGVFVDNLGNVYNKNKLKIKAKNGVVAIRDLKGNNHGINIKYLVAKAFLPQPKYLESKVIYKNVFGVNTPENLEWVFQVREQEYRNYIGKKVFNSSATVKNLLPFCYINNRKIGYSFLCQCDCGKEFTIGVRYVVKNEDYECSCKKEEKLLENLERLKLKAIQKGFDFNKFINKQLYLTCKNNHEQIVDLSSNSVNICEICEDEENKRKLNGILDNSNYLLNTENKHRNFIICKSCGRTKTFAKYTKNKTLNANYIKPCLYCETKSKLKTEGYTLLNEYDDIRRIINVKCSKGHIYNSNLVRLRAGNRCSICSTEEYKHLGPEFIKELKSEGYKPLEDYKNSKTEIRCICPKGHYWAVSRKHWLKGYRCRYCSGNSFNPNEPATLYYVKFNTNFGVLYKIGITNRSVKVRFKFEQIPYNIIWTKRFKIGSDAYVEEQNILSNFKAFKYTGEKVLTSGGNTELFIKDILNKDK